MTGKVCVVGSFNLDVVARVPRFPAPGESLIATGSSFGAGGKGANQALAAACAGAEVHFVTKLGTDTYSDFARRHLQASPIHSLSLLQSADQPTGNAVIYVAESTGENTVAVFPGANNTLTREEIDALLPVLNSADILLLQLENNLDALLHAIMLAKQAGLTVVLNPAPYSPAISEWLPKVDILTPNQSEASQLSGVTITDTDSAAAAARKIAALGVPQVIITLGAQGAVLYDGEQVQILPAFTAQVVDTTGAGDAFNGALVAALARGETLSRAATFAAAYASLAVERMGAASMPDYHEALQRLTESE